MKKIIALTVLSLSAYALQAQTTQNVRWATTIGGSSTSTTVRVEDAIKGMVEDVNSNTYVIGNYTGTLTGTKYTPQAGGTGTANLATAASYSLTSVSGSQDVFIARYDINGYCTWIASIGGAGFDEGNAITMSNPSSPSDFYITGMFNLSMTVGASTLYAVNSGYQVNDAFVIKYTTSVTGNPAVSWTQSFGGYEETCGNAILVSGSNVYVTGYYNEYVMDQYSNLLLSKTHNDGTQGTTFTTPTPGYLEHPYHDMFLARFTTAGAYSDALHTFGSEDEVEGNGITISGTSLYVTGMFKGSTRFTSASPISCNGHSDAFIAQYPTAFTSATAATAATTIGGPSTTYQSSISMPFYKQDEGYAITSSSFGIFATGRFMDQASFGGGSAIDPSGSANETYMYLVRFPSNLSGAGNAVTGSGGYSEGRGIYLATGGIMSTIHTCFVVGGGVSTASVNGSQIETNGYIAENVGFVARIGYTGSTGVWTNSFVDGIAQNENGIQGTGASDLKCVGFAVSYRLGCAVRIAGRFSSKTAFGNHTKTCSGLYDGFLIPRENVGTVTANFETCAPSVLLTGTGGTSPMWTWTGGSSATYTVTVTPTATTTYNYSTAVTGCPNSTSPVTLYYKGATANAGPDKYICETTHSTVIGTVALPGATYSWTGSCGTITSPTAAQTVITIPGSSGVSCTYTVQVTDYCGNITTDVVIVTYDATCPHRLAGPDEEETSSSAFNVFPNPNNGQFTLATSTDAPKDVYVYDMTGRIVYSNIQTTETLLSIDISSEAKGLYLVKVVTGETVQTEKISNQ